MAPSYWVRWSQLSENKVSFDEILTHHLLGSMILFMQAAAPTIYCWNSNAFIASFPFLIYGYIIFINLDHTRFFNSSPNGCISHQSAPAISKMYRYRFLV